MSDIPLTPYTTTLTDAAVRRGISVRFLHRDPDVPIFELFDAHTTLRCFNTLTDTVGTATFQLLNHKAACHAWLAANDFPVPAQCRIRNDNTAEQLRFLTRHAPVVVKPCSQWGGRGVTMGVADEETLHRAIRVARQFEDDVIMEETIDGDDLRIILVGGKLTAAISRTPANVIGDGTHTVHALITQRNRERRADGTGNLIPWDAETKRNLTTLGITPDTIPPAGKHVRVRLTNNVHTGGDVDLVTDRVPPHLLHMAERIAETLKLPIVGIDFLITRRRACIIEVSPDMAISPPEGEIVAEAFLDWFFPASARSSNKKRRA